MMPGVGLTLWIGTVNWNAMAAAGSNARMDTDFIMVASNRFDRNGEFNRFVFMGNRCFVVSSQGTNTNRCLGVKVCIKLKFCVVRWTHFSVIEFSEVKTDAFCVMAFFEHQAVSVLSCRYYYNTLY
jgi:hypothetical protein